MNKIESREVDTSANNKTGNAADHSMKGGRAVHFLRNLGIVLLSAFFGSSVQIFVMIPNGMTSGGMPGIVRIITHVFPDLSYSLVYYTLSMVVLVVVFFTMGRAEVGRIIALAFAYPIMMAVFERVDFELLETPDPFLAAILIGVFYGLATGIGYMGGFSSGGTDSIARVLKYKVFNYIPVSTIQEVIDITIIVISAFVFNRNVAIYAIITAVVAAKVISAVMIGLSGRFVQFDIISSECQAISEYVMREVGRAVTSHVSRGEYSQEERRSLTVICTPNESIRIKKFVAEIDPKAFATIMPITTVWGMDKGFSDIREVDNN